MKIPEADLPRFLSARSIDRGNWDAGSKLLIQGVRTKASGALGGKFGLGPMAKSAGLQDLMSRTPNTRAEALTFLSPLAEPFNMGAQGWTEESQLAAILLDWLVKNPEQLL